jgi:hypothetical protein
MKDEIGAEEVQGVGSVSRVHARAVEGVGYGEEPDNGGLAGGTGGAGGTGTDPDEVPVLRGSVGESEGPWDGSRAIMPTGDPIEVLEEYFERLRETRDEKLTLRAMTIRPDLDRCRAVRDFCERESRALGHTTLWLRLHNYLILLEEQCGNYVRAARDAGLTEKRVEMTRGKVEWFREQEQGVMNLLHADVQEQNIRLALGKEARVKDGQHLRWFMSHIDKEHWGEQPKQVEHKYSGSVDLKMLDAQILELLEDK